MEPQCFDERNALTAPLTKVVRVLMTYQGINLEQRYLFLLIYLHVAGFLSGRAQQ